MGIGKQVSESRKNKLLSKSVIYLNAAGYSIDGVVMEVIKHATTRHDTTLQTFRCAVRLRVLNIVHWLATTNYRQSITYCSTLSHHTLTVYLHPRAQDPTALQR